MGDPSDTSVSWGARVSSALAPVLLIGGWTLAAALQPGGFDGRARTISELGALDATDRWVMTIAIAGTGVCHVVTAAGLRPAAPVGRLLLGIGGAATVLVAMFPLPAMNEASTAHGISALTAFLCLAVWSFAAWRRAGATPDDVPWGLRRTVSIRAGAVLIALLVAFAVALGRHADVGLTERLAAGGQALWPAVVVATVPLRGRRPR